MAVDKREKPKLTTCFRDESLCCKNHLLNQIIKLARRKKPLTQDSSGSKKVPAQKNTDATTVLVRYSLTLCNL
jgi:hypothetical protein